MTTTNLPYYVFDSDAKAEYPIYKINNSLILGGIHTRSINTLPDEIDFLDYEKLLTEGIKLKYSQEEQLEKEKEMCTIALKNFDLFNYFNSKLFVHRRLTSMSNYFIREYENKEVIHLDDISPECREIFEEKAIELYGTDKFEHNPLDYGSKMKIMVFIQQILCNYTNLNFFMAERINKKDYCVNRVNHWLDNIKYEIENSKCLIYMGIHMCKNLMERLKGGKYRIEQFDHETKTFITIDEGLLEELD